MDKKGEILPYKTEDGKSQLEVLLEQGEGVRQKNSCQGILDSCLSND